MSGFKLAVVGAGLLFAARGPAADECASTVGTVSGTVHGSGGLPLAGARVRVAGCLGEPTLTDADGTFVVSFPAGPHALTVGTGGYFNGCVTAPSSSICRTVTPGETGLTVTLEALPADDDPAYVYRPAQDCAECHAGIVSDWQRSTMAHTNRNRWVDNLYNGTSIDMPAGPPPDPANPPFFGFLGRHNVDPGNPTRNGECANCHQPEYVGTNPTNTSFNANSADDRHGIACDFCHKIVEVDVSPTVITHPNLVAGKTTMLRSTSTPYLALGPLDDVSFQSVPHMRAGFSPITGDSRLCAACHEDSTDTRNANGDFEGTYAGPASQMTYTEWQQSSYAAAGVQCQDCHMPSTGETSFCSQTSNQRDPSQVRSHRFEGTSPEFLRRAVSLRSRARVAGDTLAVKVDVSNVGAGHYLPTGVTLRNMVLVVAPESRAGVALERLDGPTVPNWGGVGDVTKGAFAGLSGKGFARVLIDEFLVENVLFTEAVDAFDNRIRAGSTDSTEYHFRLPRNWQRKDVRVRTRLYYRRAFKPIADQRKWNVPLGDNAHGTRGDGSDYDENVVMAERTNFLTCRGRIAKLHGKADASTLQLSATLKLPRHSTLDPISDDLRVLVGQHDPGDVLEQALTGFVAVGKAYTYAGDANDVVQTATLTPSGPRNLRLDLMLDGTQVGALTAHGLTFGIDAGEQCFRAPLRCRVQHGRLACRSA